ncbi:hypothetical protein OGATHE_006341 [Ogataea polymorpha]|uniref:Uncharacterized protein n=1 Tax=Ogataea polymorpha TaxID=460523 RepID=A0A9P8NTS8_9ASCO|nr:hypothetical protein OGATHE_006341 [Ogataea polymorpha]
MYLSSRSVNMTSPCLAYSCLNLPITLSHLSISSGSTLLTHPGTSELNTFSPNDALSTLRPSSSWCIMASTLSPANPAVLARCTASLTVSGSLAAVSSLIPCNPMLSMFTSVIESMPELILKSVPSPVSTSSWYSGDEWPSISRFATSRITNVSYTSSGRPQYHVNEPLYCLSSGRSGSTGPATLNEVLLRSSMGCFTSWRRCRRPNRAYFSLIRARCLSSGRLPYVNVAALDGW